MENLCRRAAQISVFIAIQTDAKPTPLESVRRVLVQMGISVYCAKITYAILARAPWASILVQNDLVDRALLLQIHVFTREVFVQVGIIHLAHARRPTALVDDYVAPLPCEPPNRLIQVRYICVTH